MGCQHHAHREVRVGGWPDFAAIAGAVPETISAAALLSTKASLLANLLAHIIIYHAVGSAGKALMSLSVAVAAIGMVSGAADCPGRRLAGS
jgi:hypothetical protein